jgi:Gas vesicle protein G
VGLITGLVFLPVAPVRGVLWVAEKITEEANRQYSGDAAIVKQLREVDEARRSGKLSEEQAAAREEELLRRRIARTRGQRPMRGARMAGPRPVSSARTAGPRPVGGGHG